MIRLYPFFRILILVMIASHMGKGQDLTESRRSSHYTFIYKITNEQASELYQDIWEVGVSYLDSLIDFFPTDSTYRKRLPVGHYVFVKSVANDLHCELESVNNVDMKLLNNHRDLVAIFYDSTGRELMDLEVKSGKKKIPFEESTRSYRLARSNRHGIVSASHQGHDSFFEIDRRYNNTFFVRTGRKIIRTFPINHILSPIFYTKNNIQSLITSGYVQPPGIYQRMKAMFQPKPHTGYIVFNKPLYKPGDTVRLKAFVTTRKGKPISQPVNVHLASFYMESIDKNLGRLEPFRKGAYDFEFVLADSLDLQLDNNYYIQLKTPKNHVLLSSGFRYEDYELKQNTFSIRSENKLNGKPTLLFLKGTDSNEMPLYDVRVDILLRPKELKRYHRPHLFIPDTLWFHKMTLEPIGETRIAVPDSIIPPVTMDCEAVVSFLNTENERVDKVVILSFDKQPFPAVFDLGADSLFISVVNPGFAGQLQLRGFDSEGQVFVRPVSLPHKEKLNPFVERYTIGYGGDTRSISLSDKPDNLEILATRTRDSLLILTGNPRRILFRYFLFRNRNLIEQGETESLHLNRKAHPDDNYTLSIQYVWAGNAQTRDYEFPFDRKNLDITVGHPSLVYPGQKTTFTVTVNDALGKPVQNADLTAFSVTRKFQLPATATVPSFSRVSGRRHVFNEFNKKETDLETDKILDYDYWRNVLGLDSIAFYRFLFPDTGYYEYRMPVEISQFAPFVVKDGNVMAVQVIYVDGQPVYYKNAGTLEPYSFTIKPGLHKIELRLQTTQLTLEKVRIDSAQKLIFSVDLNQLPGNSRTIEMPTGFTKEEVSKLSRYFMLVRRNDRLLNAYIQQGGRYRLLGPTSNRYSSAELTGPFYPGKATYYQKGAYHFTFDYEPFLSYEFKANTLKQKEADIGKHLTPKFGRSSTQAPSFIDRVHTPDRIEAYWKSLEKERLVHFERFPEFTPARPGRLILEYQPVHGPEAAVKAAFVLNLDNPDEYYVVPGSVREIHFNEGHYQAVVILNDDSYLRLDSIFIKPYGINYYDINTADIHPADTFSTRILQMIGKWSAEETYNMYNREREMDRVRTLYYQRSVGRYMFGHSVTGRVVDESGEPIPGVNVLVKGTAAGTTTDLDGFYTIHCPPDGTLIFSFVGYASRENEVGGRSGLNINLQPDVMQLSEVVVTGFGVQSVSFLTGSVTQVLQGRVAGVAVVPGRGYQQRVVDSVAIRMRGVTSTSGIAPLVILDGRIVTLSEVDRDLVTAIEVLKGEEAVAIYGSRAANGIILVSTRAGANREYLNEMGKSAMMISVMESVPGNSLRQNFRDYAFWKPRLITDENGEARFDATFPDDITGWNAYVLAMASKRRTGQTSSTLQSYKPLIAQIAQPGFLIEGDEATAIGKITNYTPEKIRLQRKIRVNGNDRDSDSLEVENSKIDSISLHASGIDSISVRYSVAYRDYEDGELRKIPVYRKGTMEAAGVFLALDRDTAITIRPNHPKGEWKIYARADLIDVLMDEVRYLKNYPYDCNEQLASRIRAILVEKQIQMYRHKKFKSERDLVKAIRKLVSHQNPDGSWSWWGTGNGEAWITLHVARTLLLAEVAGYAMAFNRESAIGYLESQLPGLASGMKLNVMQFLLELGQKISVSDEIDSLRRAASASTHDKLMAERLVQLQGEKPDWNWISSIRSETVKGNYYWGEVRDDLSDNAVINTLIVYRMRSDENAGNKGDLSRIRNYFLEQRGRSWRNTYESSLILEALLPGLTGKEQRTETPKLQLSGAINKVIDIFPFEVRVANAENLTVAKSGLSPVYFTAYQESWNADPEKAEMDFGIATFFENNKGKLAAGEPVKLNIRVEVKRDAEYVMIEVPVPAGCSYSGKLQPRLNGEVHREYFHNKVNIFCRYLKKGIYDYSIDLLPRYSGKYTLNPALVECMYFPTIYGRETVKWVEIE